MAHRVIWSDEAVEDPQHISDYIARDSHHYAAAVVRRIVKSTRRLSRYPRSGRIVPEVGDQRFREILVYSYRIIYRVDERTVTIEAIAHGKRSLHFDID